MTWVEIGEFNDIATAGGAPAFIDEFSRRLMLRDDEAESAFEPGAWTSHNTASWEMPLGAIVATAELVGCIPIKGDGRRMPFPGRHVETFGRSAFVWLGSNSADCTDITDQVPYGDFTPGRWAWVLADVEPTTERCPHCRNPAPGARGQNVCPSCAAYGKCDPIPAKGRQGLWNIEW